MNPDARLRRALRPVDAPEGFARRVRDRVALQTPERGAIAAPRRRLPWWLTVAATLLAVVGGPLVYREYDARREALAARAQVLVALQIASRELNTVHRTVVRPISDRSQPSGLEPSAKEARP